ncbi:MAG: DUF2520 domain-containing protein [Acidimicrobiia bacterium]|nr:DUF2520 domain-containing protein [Acidimicrobiia bacterium]
MRIVVVGPGRAGGSLAVAARTAGHELVGLFGRRSRNESLAERLGIRIRLIGEPLPEADLLVVAVRDDALSEVADVLSPLADRVRGAIHLSGLTSVRVLDPLGEAGLATGSFHPLQTLAGWEAGSRALPGAYVGITAPEDWATELESFARSIGCRPFRVADDRKPLYHAAGGVAANYVSAALCVAEYMFREADVDPAAARPMVEQAVANSFELGFREALTGPISRGDLGTVRRQIEAVDRHAPAASEAFRVLTGLTARLAGRVEVKEILRRAGGPPAGAPSPGPATEEGGPS